MADPSSSSSVAAAPKVELHLHLDGAVRPSTVWDLAKKRGIKVPGATAEEMTSFIRNVEMGSLPKFLDTFSIFLPPMVGDKDALRRVSYELCEDKAREGVVYFETRFNPQLLIYPETEGDKETRITTRDVMQGIVQGIQEGQRDFNVKARLIICTARERPSWAAECLQLCQEFSDFVVGLDIANCGGVDETEGEDVQVHPEIVRVFQEAERCGIHRTAHAGEDGPASNVKEAIELLKAERIGHGYHALDDDAIYQMVKDKGIHLETCPTSSVYTGACDKDFTKHPCVRFIKDRISISLNTDDPTVFGNTINDEYEIAKKYFALSDEQAVQLTLNTARASFLPEQEKLELVEQLRAAYHVTD